MKERKFINHNKIECDRGMSFGFFPNFDEDKVIVKLKTKEGLNGKIKIELIDGKINASVIDLAAHLLKLEENAKTKKITLSCISGIFKGNEFDLVDGKLIIQDCGNNNFGLIQFNKFINLEQNVLDTLDINSIHIYLVKQKGTEDLSLEFFKGNTIQFIYNFNKSDVKLKAI